MRVLLVAPHFPFPPHGGSLLRTWEMIRFLGSRHQLSFVAIGPGAPNAEQMAAVEAHCQEVQFFPCNDQPTREYPETVAAWYSAELLSAVNELAGRGFDCVILEMVYLAHFADCFACPVVLSEHNIESVLFRHFAEMQKVPAQKLRWRAAALQLAAYEQKIWPKFALRTVVSEVDCNLLKARCPSGKTVVVANGADCSCPMLATQPNTNRLLFSGLLSYQPNLEAISWLVEEMMPLVWEERPDIQLVIAGARPDANLSALADGLRVILEIDPDSMEAIAQTCSLMAVGLRRGSGSRIKILQSFAWGLPVVSTGAGCEGLEVKHGEQLWIRDQAQDFARAVLDLTGQPANWLRLRQQARALCESRYDWQLIWQQFEQELLALTA